MSTENETESDDAGIKKAMKCLGELSEEDQRRCFDKIKQIVEYYRIPESTKVEEHAAKQLYEIGQLLSQADFKMQGLGDWAIQKMVFMINTELFDQTYSVDEKTGEILVEGPGEPKDYDQIGEQGRVW